MFLSIIMLTWNSERHVRQSVNAAVSSLSRSGFIYEIIVVDNGSKDTTPKLLHGLWSKFPQIIRVHYLPSNLGTTVSRNIALNMATGEFLCIMDSDVEAGNGVFEYLTSFLRKNKRVGLVAPRILYPTGQIQKSWDRFPTLLHKAHRFLRLHTMELKEQAKVVKTRDVDYAISAFWLFPRHILNTIGFLDEKIFYSPEDVDYCLRIWKAGYRIVYLPSVSVVHHTQEISRGWKPSKAKLSHLKGLIYLFIKHHYFFSTPNFKASPKPAAGGIK